MNRATYAGLLAATLLAAACSGPPPDSASAEVEHLSMPGTEGLKRPFSTAVRVDDTLYLSGVIGTDASGRQPMPGGIQAETRRALEIIREEVETFGSSMDRVVKCTVFLADIGEWGAMNEVYVTFFETPPARSALGASGLALNARVEIECIAVIE